MRGAKIGISEVKMQFYNLVIIIVNYNSSEDTIACIESIKQSKTDFSYKVIVVDNCSTDDSARRLKENADYDFIASEANGGYCSGNNTGIKYAESKYNFDYVLILNPDTVIENFSITNLLRFAYEHKNYGVIGSTLLYYWNRNIVQGVGGGKIGFTRKLAFDILPPYHHGESFSAIKDSLPPYIECDSLIGAALLIQKDVFQTVGYFDETYFLYSDETEFCLRIKKNRTYKLTVVTNSIVYHKEGAKKENGQGVSQYYIRRNWYYNTRKYFPVMLPYVLLWNLLYISLLKIKKEKARYYYHANALRDFLLKRTGKFHGGLYSEENRNNLREIKQGGVCKYSVIYISQTKLNIRRCA